MHTADIKPDRLTMWVNSKIPYMKQRHILICLCCVLATLTLCRGSIKEQLVVTEEVTVEVEKVIYKDDSDKYEAEALQVARVLYGLADYHLNDEQKIAVIEVILNRTADTAREFREYNTVIEVCNQPQQWQGYKADGQFLESDYQLALKRLSDSSGARVIPEGCYFLTVAPGAVTVRTEFNGGNEWNV